MRKHTRTFKKGIHFPDMKYLAKDKPIEPMPPSEHYFVALSQHIGAPAKPVVEVGATVAAGTLIARADGMISANVFSPVSGTVAGIETRKNKQGANAPFIHIKNDFKNREEFMPPADVSDARAVRERIGEAGIVGLGGAGFPTLVKLSPSKPVDILIINAAECEPYLTCDYRVMLDRTEEFVKGVKILSSCLGVARTVIGIEENKMEAYEKLRAFDGFELILLEKKYPQGGEKQLIYACCGRVVPAKALPMDVGVVVQNVATALAVYEAVEKGKPLYERVVTVSGKGVAEPKNLLVKTGTLFEEALDFCGGISEDTQKLIAGGPMMGTSLYDASGVFTKTDSGLLALTGEEANVSQPSNCISCGACARACPMNLMPMYIDFYALAGDFKTSEKYGTNHCIECGCCANVCPAKRPLVQSIRLAKAKLREKAK
ncbi:electron transport complex protein RnfC [Subdoligranulum sp. CAG:314]|nr:electron transport complex protein RnfC [Subdoligranulum sp. CAG:314]